MPTKPETRSRSSFIAARRGCKFPAKVLESIVVHLLVAATVASEHRGGAWNRGMYVDIGQGG